MIQWFLQLLSRRSRRTKRVLLSYYAQHRVCPECGHISHAFIVLSESHKRRTHLLITPDPIDPRNPKEYVDTRHYVCPMCGWVGTLHDLQPLNQEEHDHGEHDERNP